MIKSVGIDLSVLVSSTFRTASTLSSFKVGVEGRDIYRHYDGILGDVVEAIQFSEQVRGVLDVCWMDHTEIFDVMLNKVTDILGDGTGAGDNRAFGWGTARFVFLVDLEQLVKTAGSFVSWVHGFKVSPRDDTI